MLRVAVHGSSGLFSQAFFRIGGLLRTSLSLVKNDYINVITQPEVYPRDHVLMQRLEQANAAYRKLLFGHYLLAEVNVNTRTLGGVDLCF